MAVANVNGISIHYEEHGSGEPVLFVAGSGAAGRSWQLQQTPAFVKAGYRAITFDNRGIAPSSECATGFTIADMVADTAALIEHLGIGPVRIVGTSMGAQIVQELAVARPDLIRRGALLATRARRDAARAFFSQAEADLLASGITLPVTYDAMVRVLQNFSRKTLNDDRAIQDWIDIFTMWPVTATPGVRVQMGFEIPDGRIEAYRRITTEMLVISFAEDVLLPAHLGREVADAIPDAKYVEIPDAGHYGYLEQPDAVNKALLDFFAAA